MALSDLQRLKERFLDDLEKRERSALLRMAVSYADITQRMRDSVESNWKRIAELKAAGEEVTASMLFQDARMRSLLSQAEREYARWAAEAAVEARGLQAAATRIATDAVRAEMDELLAPSVAARFDVLPRNALVDLIGKLDDGSPLSDLFDEIAPQVKDKMRGALITGLAVGENPNDVGRRMAKESSIGLSRGVRIARTEMMRSYRDTHTRNYKANSDVVSGWRWIATRDERVCPFCESMDGTVHDLNERLESHPNCRCTPAPITRRPAARREEIDQQETE